MCSSMDTNPLTPGTPGTCELLNAIFSCFFVKPPESFVSMFLIEHKFVFTCDMLGCDVASGLSTWTVLLFAHQLPLLGSKKAVCVGHRLHVYMSTCLPVM